jgi:hypothetical protein
MFLYARVASMFIDKYGQDGSSDEWPSGHIEYVTCSVQVEATSKKDGSLNYPLWKFATDR